MVFLYNDWYLSGWSLIGQLLGWSATGLHYAFRDRSQPACRSLSIYLFAYANSVQNKDRERERRKEREGETKVKGALHESLTKCVACLSVFV